MSDRLDVLVGKERGGKTYYTKVGVAFRTKAGDGWSVTLDALPTDGKLLLLPPRESRGSQPQREPGDDNDDFGPGY